MIWSIVLAAGSGTRYGRIIPKQYELLAGRRVIDWSVDSAAEVSDGVVLVVGPEHGRDESPSVDEVVVGGETRAESVRAGLAVVPEAAEVIVVHDSARPLASPDLFRTVIRALAAGVDGAVPGVAVADTLKRVEDGAVVSTLDREGLVAVQTPQAFAAAALRRAHASNGEATDDATLVEKMGGRVAVVEGEPRNLKITQPSDLVVAEAFLR